MTAIRTRLTYANVMATIAVFVALGGSALAIDKIKANSVGSKQIKAKAVKNGDIADNAVTSVKVADGSLLGDDFAAGQLPAGPAGPKGDTGAPGAPGEPGAPGQPGAPGANATNLFAYVTDPGTADADTHVVYGSGVTGVVEPPGSNSYLVTFNRSVVNCAVQATVGRGDPSALAPFPPIAVLNVDLTVGPADQVQVFSTTPGGAAQDTPFFITAFC